ncbi:uncharacterized protein LOC143042306 [Mytilus galloprovincialis]|uniref:uncharacterized protein LOC143042306 n=1 Tax=Mytilus galloprovincialis TaxID=29158 RepID=UPI003F7BA787
MSLSQLYDQSSSRPRKVRAPYQSIDCQSLVALSGAVSGWLRRRESSVLKKWTKKFTVLYSGHVYTYKNETCVKQIDHFSLYGYISVERDLDIEDKEQLWVIKIIPAVGSPNKPIYFALPSEKDLHMWADRFFKELLSANDEEYARSMNSEMVQLSLHRSESELSVYDEVEQYTEREERRLVSPTSFFSTQSLPALCAQARSTGPSSKCSSSSSNIYEGRRVLPGPPLPPRRPKTSESQQELGTKNNGQAIVKFDLNCDGNSNDGETQNNSESLSWGYEKMENIQEGHRSLCNFPRGESKKPYDQPAGVYTEAASEPTVVPRKERKESLYDTIRNVSRKSSNLNTSNHLIPHALLERNDKAVGIYNECLKLGKDRQNKVRIIVVGPKKSGKTCLVRRLLRKEIEDVKSTNGVEMHALKCKAKLSDMTWICQEESSIEKDVNSRLLKSIIDTYKEIEDTKGGNTDQHYKNTENTDNSTEDDPFSIETDKWEPTYDTVDAPCTYDSKRVEYENISEDLHDLCEILKAPIDEDDFVQIDFWDFAGATEYYNTHKAFLLKDAIYIVTFDVSKTTQDVSVEESRYELNFWLETIRSFGAYYSIIPSVFIVGTHTDKFKGSRQQCMHYLKTEVKKAVENGETRKHVRNYYLVSNTDDTDTDFEEMREQLLVTAQTPTSWNETRPVRWIYLEKTLLEELNIGEFVLSKAKILEIAANTNQPISDPDELEAFLVYHHRIGTYTYFKDLPDCVVLLPQWIANAFRCIVFADIFHDDVSMIAEWNLFRTTGRLSDNLLDHLFSCQSLEIKEHREKILALMENFDIIVRPKIKLESNEIVQESHYFVPCMTRTQDIAKVIGLFKCESKSSWLCLELEFLPPPLTTSLLIAYSRELAVASVVNSTGDNGPVIYSNFALFYLKEAEEEMLLIAAHKNIIQMQVWKRGHIKRSYSSLRQKLNECIQRFCRFFQMKLCYKTKLKCSASALADCAGMEDIDKFKEETQYFCKMHSVFRCTNEMSSDWIETTLKQTLTKEQINASRMSMIMRGVLTDALYDRLAVDYTPLRSRTECDIPYVYAELRRQNRHMPTKGSWGGSLTDIKDTHKKIGDDIERIRLVRSEILHLSPFAIDNSRYTDLCRLVRDVAKRMELNNNKNTDYTNDVKDILQRGVSHKQFEEQEIGIKHEKDHK